MKKKIHIYFYLFNGISTSIDYLMLRIDANNFHTDYIISSISIYNQ